MSFAAAPAMWCAWLSTAGSAAANLQHIFDTYKRRMGFVV